MVTLLAAAVTTHAPTTAIQHGYRPVQVLASQKVWATFVTSLGEGKTSFFLDAFGGSSDQHESRPLHSYESFVDALGGLMERPSCRIEFHRLPYGDYFALVESFRAS